jgi:chemotaxis protein methyltransferase CheR
LNPSAVVADADYPRLKSHVIESTGLAYYRDKDEDLARHIAERLGALGLPSCAAYLAAVYAEQGQQELDALIAQLTIGETYFFRHTEQFDALRLTVIPDILARNQQSRRLRIWSAGCAIGAEPYSIAALLREFDDRTAGWDVCILGTDINRHFLARANEGRFENWAFRGVPEAFKQRYFRQVGKSWLISDALKSKVTFQYHNLVKHTFPSLTNNLFGFDLIVCRNVMIYFDAAVIAAVVARLRESLVDGGWLVVGHAESAADSFRDFRIVSEHGAAVYQRTCPAAPAAETAGPAVFSLPAVAASSLPLLEPAPSPIAAGAGTALDLAPAVSAAPPCPEPELETVRLLADRGEWQQAAGVCRKLLARNGLDPLAHFYNALILEQTGAAAEARQELHRAIYLDRKFVLAHYHLGLMQQKERDATQAARSFENVIELLARCDDQQAFSLADGITVGELRELTRAHLEVLGTRA